jgi:two-component system chemotaxis response regulator CheB
MEAQDRAGTRVAPQLPDAAFDVVGLAASAGGLQALSAVLRALPADFPVALLVVQHLDPRRSSMMAEILGRHTELRVEEARTGRLPEAGSVYLAPPDHHLLLGSDGVLLLTQTAVEHFVRPSADVLFRSLAESGARVVAVVLSGTGTDGCGGVGAIKAAGGTIIVQDPGSAEFPGMPEAAVATGCADHVLALEEIGTTLVALVRGEKV